MRSVSDIFFPFNNLYWTAATSLLYPMFWILWEVLYVPFRLVLGLCSLLAFVFSNAYDLIGDIWLFMSSIFQFASNADVAVSSYEVSMWRTLWNDLFSQVIKLYLIVICSKDSINCFHAHHRFSLLGFSCCSEHFEWFRCILHSLQSTPAKVKLGF